MIYEFFSGSWAAADQEGIVKFRMDTDRETIEKEYAFTGILRPSYLAFNPDKTILYTVQEETPEGKVHALKLEQDGLVPLKDLSTKGADPCHVSMDLNCRLMFADNYTSGSIAVYRMGKDGLPAEMCDFVQHRFEQTPRQEAGVNQTRQEGPHCHYTKEHNGQAFVADLGMDRVFIYDIDFKNGKFTDTGKRISFPAGCGPRHIEFHRTDPDIIYVICELASRIMVFRRDEEAADGSGYVLKQDISTLPEDFRGENIAAAVKMQNRLLFATNRGHDSIALYHVEDDGCLTLKQIVKTGGRTPRDFTMFGDFCVIADQDSDSIDVLKVDWETETMTPTKMRAETPKPTCIRKY
ncbi:MAG: lactonase family protein [Stomatobaculum sp.]|nr:lactonase family protein [Stomatobaculum sp.]